MISNLLYLEYMNTQEPFRVERALNFEIRSSSKSAVLNPLTGDYTL